jgi:hypothetical protein
MEPFKQAAIRMASKSSKSNKLDLHLSLDNQLKYIFKEKD